MTQARGPARHFGPPPIGAEARPRRTVAPGATPFTSPRSEPATPAWSGTVRVQNLEIRGRVAGRVESAHPHRRQVRSSVIRFDVIWTILSEAERQAIRDLCDALGIPGTRWSRVPRLRAFGVLAATVRCVREAELAGRTREQALIETSVLLGLPVTTIDMSIRRAVEHAFRSSQMNRPVAMNAS